MPIWLRPFVWPLIFLSLAAVIYFARIQREMVDFDVYRTAAHRAIAGEPLYRPTDGHYQFKYLPAFALAMAPFALVDSEAAKVIWFALSAGLLTAFLRWSVRALPERRGPSALLFWLTVLFMAKFYAHELTLGQTNILLGALLVGSLLAVQVDQPYVAGVLIGAGGIRQAVRPAPAALARIYLWRLPPPSPRLACSSPAWCCRPWSTAGAETSISSSRGSEPSRARPKATCSGPTTCRWRRCGPSGSASARRPRRWRR